MSRRDVAECLELIVPDERRRRDRDCTWQIVFGVMAGCLLLKIIMLIVARRQAKRTQAARIEANKLAANPFENMDSVNETPTR